jgi:hypothetical protein
VVLLVVKSAVSKEVSLAVLLAFSSVAVLLTPHIQSTGIDIVQSGFVVRPFNREPLNGSSTINTFYSKALTRVFLIINALEPVSLGSFCKVS